ncbi:MAG: hypothetical protein ACPIOQ_47370, partial [Promethearchaeia archaeon]
MVQRVLELLGKDDVLSDKSRKRNKAKKAFRAHLIQHLRGEVRKTLDHWKIEPHEVAPEEQEKLVSLMVEQSSKKWKVIADIVTDPKSAPEVFVTVLGSVCTSETRELLQKMVGIILRRKLVDRGIEHEDAEKLLQLLNDRLDLAQGFSSPQSAVQKLLTLFGELQGSDLTGEVDAQGSGGADSRADLVLRCARAVAVHYLKQKFDSRGYDSRALELAEVVIDSMPPDKLSKAMTKKPTEILALVLDQAVKTGSDFAQEWLTECVKDIKEDVRARMMLATGMSEDQVDKVVELAGGSLEDPEEAAQALEAASEAVVSQSMSGFAGGGFLAMFLWFLKERFLLAFDMVSDAAVAYNMCDPAEFGGECRYGSQVEHRETRRLFFAGAVFFICLSWSVLWLAVCMHFVLPHVRDFGGIKQAFDSSIKQAFDSSSEAADSLGDGARKRRRRTRGRKNTGAGAV